MDQKEIKWSERANIDLGKIFDHVAENFNPNQALTAVNLILKKVENLTRFPRAGSVSPDFPEIRELVVQGNVVFYRITDKDIIIAAIRPRGTN
jgi:addiction module RelE/StbE family toxin